MRMVTVTGCDHAATHMRGTTQMNQLIASVTVAVAVIGTASLARADEPGKNAKDPPRVERTTAPAGSPCVDANGSWVNWPYANVPTLSPPCSAPLPAVKK